MRLLEEFVFLDGHSRRCIGWALHRSLHAELTLAALRMALGQRHLRPGIVHHSDRGVQYACRDDVALLEQHGFRISMSRAGNPYDNAQAESFLKTLKYEEVYRFEYRNFHEAHTRIGEFIETVYNTKRLHSALGSATGRVRTERPMSFLRHGESIPPMSANKTGKEVRPLPPTHRQNEFQPAIPWQGCSPAEPRLRFTGQPIFGSNALPRQPFCSERIYCLSSVSQSRGAPQGEGRKRKAERRARCIVPLRW